MSRLTSALISTLMLSACDTIPDKNIDPAKNNVASFRKDWKECREDYPEQGSGVHIRQWQGCMEFKGWK